MSPVCECYCALAVSVLTRQGPESAFLSLHRKKQTHSKIPDADIPWLVEQRKSGVPYHVLGEKYGVKGDTVHKFMQRRGVLEYVLKRGGKERESNGDNVIL